MSIFLHAEESPQPWQWRFQRRWGSALLIKYSHRAEITKLIWIHLVHANPSLAPISCKICTWYNRTGKKKKKTKLKGAGSLLQPNPMYRFLSISNDSHNRLHGAGQDIHTASGLSSSLAHIMLVSVSAAVLGMHSDDRLWFRIGAAARKGRTQIQFEPRVQIIHAITLH